MAGLVYVSALGLVMGESTGEEFAEIQAPPGFVIEPQSNGFSFVNGPMFRSGFASDLNEADAAFLRESQVPISTAAFDDRLILAAWRTKPIWFVVATEDGAIDPRLLRKTAHRIGAETEEVKGNHVAFLSQPRAVADVIDRAARGATRARR